MLTNLLIFRPRLHSSKNSKLVKNRRKSNNEIKCELLKSLIDSEIEFKFG